MFFDIFFQNTFVFVFYVKTTKHGIFLFCMFLHLLLCFRHLKVYIFFSICHSFKNIIFSTMIDKKDNNYFFSIKKTRIIACFIFFKKKTANVPLHFIIKLSRNFENDKQQIDINFWDKNPKQGSRLYLVLHRGSCLGFLAKKIN